MIDRFVRQGARCLDQVCNLPVGPAASLLPRFASSTKARASTPAVKSTASPGWPHPPAQRCQVLVREAVVLRMQPPQPAGQSLGALLLPRGQHVPELGAKGRFVSRACRPSSAGKALAMRAGYKTRVFLHAADRSGTETKQGQQHAA